MLHGGLRQNLDAKKLKQRKYGEKKNISYKHLLFQNIHIFFTTFAKALFRDTDPLDKMHEKDCHYLHGSRQNLDVIHRFASLGNGTVNSFLIGLFITWSHLLQCTHQFTVCSTNQFGKIKQMVVSSGRRQTCLSCQYINCLICYTY